MSLTNLLVSVEASKDDDTDPKDVHLVYKNSDFDPVEDLDLFAVDDEIADDSTSKKPEVNFQVVINPEKLIPPNVKRYANPNTLFVDKDTEFLDNEENVAKRNARAKRFGTENETTPSSTTVANVTNVDDEVVQKLYASFDIKPDNVKDKQKYRLNAIYLRGVQDMSTDDIFFYLRKFSPNFIEWINDKCCNVVWNDKTNAIRAMLQNSKPMKKVNLQKRQKFDENNKSPLKRSKDDAAAESDDGALMDSDVEEAEQMDDSGESCEIVDTSQHTVPPGYWRVGEKCEKSSLILFRFATIDDVKMRNAEKESIFYKKYGNPNYGGTVGLISRSRKRKLRGGGGDDDDDHVVFTPDFDDEVEQQVTYMGDLRGKLKKNYRWEQIKNSNRRSSDEEEFSPYSDEEADDMRSKSKSLRMQMRADDVEKKQKTRRTQLRAIRKRTGIAVPVAVASAAVDISDDEDEVEEGEILFDDDNVELEYNRSKPQITTDLRERLKKYRMKITVENTSGDDDKKLSDVEDD